MNRISMGRALTVGAAWGAVLTACLFVSRAAPKPATWWLEGAGNGKALLGDWRTIRVHTDDWRGVSVIVIDKADAAVGASLSPDEATQLADLLRDVATYKQLPQPQDGGAWL